MVCTIDNAFMMHMNRYTQGGGSTSMIFHGQPSRTFRVGSPCGKVGSLVCCPPLPTRIPSVGSAFDTITTSSFLPLMAIPSFGIARPITFRKDF